MQMREKKKDCHIELAFKVQFENPSLFDLPPPMAPFLTLLTTTEAR